MQQARIRERRALVLSPIGYLVFGLLGIGFFFFTHSEAILLDGVSSLILLVLFTLPITFVSLKENLPQILHAAPPDDVQADVRKRVAGTLQGFDHRERSIRMIQMGRIFYVLVHVIHEKETRSLDLQHCDRIRDEIEQALADLHPRPMADVIFTANDRDLLKP